MEKRIIHKFGSKTLELIGGFWVTPAGAVTKKDFKNYESLEKNRIISKKKRV